MARGGGGDGVSLCHDPVEIIHHCYLFAGLGGTVLASSRKVEEKASLSRVGVGVDVGVGVGGQAECRCGCGCGCGCWCVQVNGGGMGVGEVWVGEV